jgi:hypothetical protein
MFRKTSARYAALALFVPWAIGLASCSHPSSNVPGGSSSGSSSGACAAGYVAGTVGGQPKCLQNGQQCQPQNAADYRKYGFTCTKANGRYQLKPK